MGINSACLTFGHAWHVAVKNGRLVEWCSVCGARPNSNPYIADMSASIDEETI